MELEDGITLQIADAVKALLNSLEDKNGESIFHSNIHLGRIDRLMALNGPISELYVNDETDFEYDLDEDEHTEHKTEVIIAIYVKGVDDKPERQKLNIKDLTLKLIEDNPHLNDLTSDCTILRVENGQRAEGLQNKPALFGASMIHVQYTIDNLSESDEDDEFDSIDMRGELIDSQN